LGHVPPFDPMENAHDDSFDAFLSLVKVQHRAKRADSVEKVVRFRVQV